MAGDLTYGIELLITGLLIGSMYSMVALGVVLIYKASGVFNYAQGAMTLFAALTVVGLLPYCGLWGSLLATALVMALLALLAERAVFRPLKGSDPLTLFMGTIGLASILEGFAQIVWGSQPRGLKLGLPADPFKVLGVYISKADAAAALIALAFVLALVWSVRRTKFGLGLRAIADDYAAAQVVGIPLRTVWAGSWAIAGIVAIAAGVLWGGRIGVHFGMSMIALKALPVLIIGGVDSIAGAIVGGLIVGASEALGEGFLGSMVGGGVQDVVAYLVALGFLAFAPSGLFGQQTVRRV
jgi:branched-chain amino acid transport system permease protein